jgi:hypothetical protein
MFICLQNGFALPLQTVRGCRPVCMPALGSVGGHQRQHLCVQGAVASLLCCSTLMSKLEPGV